MNPLALFDLVVMVLGLCVIAGLVAWGIIVIIKTARNWKVKDEKEG